MVLEVAILDVRAGDADAFESAFRQAREIIASMPGFVSLELQRGIEHDHRYALLVRWETLEHHTVGFRGSPEYERWRELLHHFYDPFPVVEHFEPVVGG
jgi:heme-degrading monooxygenase HmoA